MIFSYPLRRRGLLRATLLQAFYSIRSERQVVPAQPRVKRLLGAGVDGTRIEAWASTNSLRPKDGDEPPAERGGRNREADFHRKKHSSKSRASTTDPQARLYRKRPGKDDKLCLIGHHHGLFGDASLTQATEHAERKLRQRATSGCAREMPTQTLACIGQACVLSKLPHPTPLGE